MLLTHERDDDGLGDVVSLDVAGLAGVAARLRARHLLQHQALVRQDHALALVVHNLLALQLRRQLSCLGQLLVSGSIVLK